MLNCGVVRQGKMWVRRTVLVTFAFSLAHSELCKYGKWHKLTQVKCSNFEISLEEEIPLPSEISFEKLVFKNVSGSLDLANITLNTLKYLLISHSEVHDLTFGNFSNLVFLTFEKNPNFPNLTRDLFEPASHINWLSLISNNHSIESEAFQLLTNLTWLHIQNQNLTHLTPDFFQRNSKLHELSIRNCKLEFIDSDAFAATSELEILSLSFNKLTHFEFGTFENLTKLKILELHHNKLLHVNLRHFHDLVSLEVMGLPSHSLKNLNASSLLEVFPNLKKMEMKRKDLVKNEDIKGLVQELREEGIDIIGTPHDCHNWIENCALNWDST